MGRKIRIALLALGTLGGFASGFASLRWHSWHQQARFEERVTQVCGAAARADRDAPAPAQAHAPGRD